MWFIYFFEFIIIYLNIDIEIESYFRTTMIHEI